MPGFNTLTRGGTTRSKGLAILARDTHPLREIPTTKHSSRILACEYQGHALVNVYAPVSCSRQEKLEGFVAKLEITIEDLRAKGYNAIIVGGDMNCDPGSREGHNRKLLRCY